jgi:hypothetical protein
MNRRSFVKLLGCSPFGFLLRGRRDYVSTNSPHESRILLVTNNPLHSDLVQSGFAYKTVNDAAKVSRRGDVILVHPGTYNESVVVPSGVYLEGFDGHVHFKSIKGNVNLV